MGIGNTDNGLPSRTLEPPDVVGEAGAGEQGLEFVGDGAQMRTLASSETKPWRNGSLQSRNGPSATEFVGDAVMLGDGPIRFGETPGGDVGDSGGSSRYHESGSPWIDA